MNKLRVIRYFAIFIIFCAEYRCAPNETWAVKTQRWIEEASNVEPHEKMKVDIQNIIFENTEGVVVKSCAHVDKSLTLIANEHLMPQEGENSDEHTSEARALYRFEIRSTIFNSTSESILTFWSMHIKLFIFFVSTNGRIKLLAMPIINEGFFTVDFLNPGDAQQFHNYALKNRRQKRKPVINVSKFEIFNRRTKELVEGSSFVVIYKEFARRPMASYTISSTSGGVAQNPLLIFSSWRYCVSDIIKDRMGLLVTDEPNFVFILHFSSSENNAAVNFLGDLRTRSITLDSILDRELRSFIE